MQKEDISRSKMKLSSRYRVYFSNISATHRVYIFAAARWKGQLARLAGGAQLEMLFSSQLL
jgi:hypothetical protein